MSNLKKDSGRPENRLELRDKMRKEKKETGKEFVLFQSLFLQCITRENRYQSDNRESR